MVLRDREESHRISGYRKDGISFGETIEIDKIYERVPRRDENLLTEML